MRTPATGRRRRVEAFFAGSHTMTPQQERNFRRNRETVKRQPHRNGSDDPKLESALGRFCQRHHLGEHCYVAGVEYGNIVRESIKALGLPTLGFTPGRTNGDGEPDHSALRARKELARQRELDANDILVSHGCTAGTMKMLCYEERDIIGASEKGLYRGLAALARTWGMTPRRSFD